MWKQPGWSRVAEGRGGVFRGRTDPRVRASWRILLATVVALGGVGVLAWVVAPVYSGAVWQRVTVRVLDALVVLVILVGAARFVDRRRVRGYGFRFTRGWWLDAGAGVLLGGLLIGVLFVIGYARGMIGVNVLFHTGGSRPFLLWLGLVLVGWIAVAFWEEVVFRGIVMKNTAEGLFARGVSLGWIAVITIVVGAVVFTVVHARYGGVPFGTSRTNMVVVWVLLGGLFGVAYVLSGELAFPIGLHTALNFAYNNVFFGITTEPTIIRPRLGMNGINHPFADLPLVAGLLLAGYGLTLWWFYWRAGELRPDPRLIKWSERHP